MMLWILLITVALSIILGCMFVSSDKHSECTLGTCGIVMGVIGGICMIIYIVANIRVL